MLRITKVSKYSPHKVMPLTLHVLLNRYFFIFQKILNIYNISTKILPNRDYTGVQAALHYIFLIFINLYTCKAN
jgi:hypothetical protein